MTTIYTYTREKLGTGCWDIDNPSRTKIVQEDGEGVVKQVHLAHEIETKIPAKCLCSSCGVICIGDTCKIIFDNELTSAEKDILDSIVYDHKNNITQA